MAQERSRRAVSMSADDVIMATTFRGLQSRFRHRAARGRRCRCRRWRWRRCWRVPVALRGRPAESRLRRAASGRRRRGACCCALLRRGCCASAARCASQRPRWARRCVPEAQKSNARRRLRFLRRTPRTPGACTRALTRPPRAPGASRRRPRRHPAAAAAAERSSRGGPCCVALRCLLRSRSRGGV